MSFHYRHRKLILICIILLFIISVSSFYIYNKLYKRSNKNKDIKIVSNKSSSNNKILKDSKTKELIQVDIKGEIVSPGIYELEEGSRVIDVINKANGLTDSADTTVINLSKKIKDEMVIIIYSHEQVENFKQTKEQEANLIDKCIHGDNDSLINDACISGDDSNNNSTLGSLININTSSLEELKTLPGVGDSKAKSIIEYRDKNSGFKSIEEIKNVDGIGDNLYDQIKTLITV